MRKNFLKTFFAALFILASILVYSHIKDASSQTPDPQADKVQAPLEQPKPAAEPVKIPAPAAKKAPDKPVKTSSKAEIKDAAPTASVSVKDGSTVIEIKNLDLTGDQTERLKEEIERKLKVDRMPDDWNINMTVKITDEMLDRAGIHKGRDETGKATDDDWTDSEGNKSHSNWKHREHGLGSSRVRIFSNVTVAKGEKLDDIVVIGGNLKVEGEINEFVVIMGNAEVGPEAKVNGDCVVLMGALDVSPTSVIKGDQVNINGGRAIRSIFKYAIVPGTLLSFLAFTPFAYAFKMVFCFLLFGFALLLFAIFPATTAASKSYIVANPLAAFGLGILAMLAVIPISLFLLISVIGIPLLPVFILLVLLALFGGFAIGAFFLGSLILLKLFKTTIKWALLLGIFLVGLIFMIPVIGCMILWVVITIGFGAVCYSIFQALSRRKPPQAPPTSQASAS